MLDQGESAQTGSMMVAKRIAMASAVVALVSAVSVYAGEGEGVTSDTAPIWYQAYLLLLSVGLPLYVFLGWLRRRLRECRGMQEFHCEAALTNHRNAIHTVPENRLARQ
jgi:hypothetical protein